VLANRSGCPINLTLEVLGDTWSLLIIRDMMFGNRRHFRDLLQKSDEGIASNILADRLKRLLEQGIMTRASDPSHKQKGIYSLTEQGIQLVPVLAQMAGWGCRFLPVTDELGIRGRLLEEGGPKMWEKFMSELRVLHLGAATRRKSRSGTESVGAKLDAPHAATVPRRKTKHKVRRRIVKSRVAKRTSEAGSARKTVSMKLNSKNS
jgi:DNA-binding HxlR family transcriptional regulator